MKLSVKSRYGLKVMLTLAENYGNGTMPLSYVASQTDISEPYLEKLFSMLKKANLVVATRGASGGYELIRAPKDISVGEVVRGLEDGLEIIDCINGSCEEQNKCVAYGVWNKLYHAINDTLDSISLESLIRV